MTILVKANTIGKNPAGVALLQLIAPPPLPPKPVKQVKRVRKGPPTYSFRIRPSAGSLLVLSMLTLAVVVLGLTCGMIMFREYVRGNSLRYRGTCTITSTKDDDYILVNAMPSKLFDAPEIKLYSSASDLINTRLMNELLEEMAIEDNLETITVHDGYRTFDIIHDFDENITSIRNEDRCFIMNMIREFVLEPRSLIDGFHNESRLELSHAHSRYRAELPAFRVATVPAASISRNCYSSKPVYRLSLEDSLVLRKRSLDVRTTVPTATEPLTPEPVAGENSTKMEPPKQDFVQFSGNHLQRITISNMDDILQYEISNSVNVHPKLRAAQ